MNKIRYYVACFGLLLAALSWGSTFYLVKASILDVAPAVLLAYRFLTAAFIMAIYLVLARKALWQNFSAGCLLGLVLWVLYVPQTIALKYISAADSGFITGLFVVFVPVFDYLFFKRIPNRMQILTVSIALFGLYLLTGGLKSFNQGDLLTLLCAMAYASHILIVDKLLKDKIDPIILTFQQFFVVGILSLSMALITKSSFHITHLHTSFSIIFLTLAPTLLAFLIQILAQRIVSPLAAALIFTLEPVFAAIFAWTIGGEKFITQAALGGLCVVISMIIGALTVENAATLQPAVNKTKKIA
jgi:drug/metabolite transporter (DMT)-like permease